MLKMIMPFANIFFICLLIQISSAKTEEKSLNDDEFGKISAIIALHMETRNKTKDSKVLKMTSCLVYWHDGQ